MERIPSIYLDSGDAILAGVALDRGVPDTMASAAFVYQDQLSRHVLRADHPMRPVRLRMTYELLEALGAFSLPGARLVAPRPATEEEVLLFHTRSYVDAVRGLGRGLTLIDAGRYGFSERGDNPPYLGMYNAAMLSTGASIVAAEMVASGAVQAAFSIAGGLHHAMPDRASGFCVYNDPVVAIRWMVGRGLRVAYVDIDAHHGDGVQSAFYETDRVLTISLHESGQYLFPGTGFPHEAGAGAGVGYSVNVPLAPFTDDAVYLEAFQQVVPPLVNAFRPDVLVTQLGIDTYHADPLTHLALTTRGYVRAVEALAALGYPWLALGGGGYDLSAVARCWTLAYGVMLGQEWPDAIPDVYRARYGIATLRDAASPALRTEAVDQARLFAQVAVDEVQRLVFPYHGLST